MLATCPHCQTRYRIADGRIGPEGARLRCRRCSGTFRVEAGHGAAEPAFDSQLAVATSGGPPSVVVALRDHELAKRTAATLTRWGGVVEVCGDGVEAVLAMQRGMPQAAVVDAAVERMRGAEVCELAKRNASLRGIVLVIAGDAGGHDGTEFVPDARIDSADMPDALPAVLCALGLQLSQPAPVEAAAAMPVPEAPTPAAAPPEPQVEPSGDPELEAARAEALRLARIVVSDIVLYNEERFEQAARSGDVAEAMVGELREGRALFDSRIDPRVLSERDFLLEELERVAASRRG